MRFRDDLSRPKFDAVTAIELGDLTRGYRAIDISETSTELYSVACNLYLGIKEWQAITNYLKSLPAKNAQGVTVLAMDERASEIRAIKQG